MLKLYIVKLAELFIEESKLLESTYIIALPITTYELKSAPAASMLFCHSIFPLFNFSKTAFETFVMSATELKSVVSSKLVELNPV